MRTHLLPVGGVLIAVTIPDEFLARIARLLVSEANWRRRHGPPIHAPAAWAPKVVRQVLEGLASGSEVVARENHRLDTRIARWTSDVEVPTGPPDLEDLLSIMATGRVADSRRGAALDPEQLDESRAALLAVLGRHPDPDDDCELCGAIQLGDWGFALLRTRLREEVVVALYDSLAAAQIVPARRRLAMLETLEVNPMAGWAGPDVARP